jgi:hypothetical protein
MISLVIQSYTWLLVMDVLVTSGKLHWLNSIVRRCNTRTKGRHCGDSPIVIRSLGLACVLYPKRALCLQRSAALTVLLKTHGVPAQLILAAQPVPFKAHAWVEVDGSVVGDRSYIPTDYLELHRC